MQIPSGDYVYIIGAQKAATSSLHRLLARHPDIYFCPQEAAFFDLATYEDSSENRRRFAAFFDGRTTEHILGLKRPNYLHLDDVVPARIKTYTPDARFIAVLRDPIKRAVSAYYHYVRNSHLPVADINEGLPRLLDGEWADRYARVRNEILDFGMYARQFEHWFEHFKRDRFRIFLLQDVKTDMRQILRDCCRFLGVVDDVDFGTLKRKQKESVYSLHRLRVLQLVSFRQMGEFDLKKMSAEDQRFVKTIRDFDRSVLSRLFPAGKPVLTPELKQRLQELYRDDSERLANMLGRDLSHWSVFDS